MGLAPSPRFSERTGSVYEEKTAPSKPGNRGRLWPEEGLATDTDVPKDFVRGATEGVHTSSGGANNVNPETQFKHAAETMQERAHPGSAAWVEAPSHLKGFVQGVGEPPVTYPQVTRSGTRQEAPNPARVSG